MAGQRQPADWPRQAGACGSLMRDLNEASERPAGRRLNNLVFHMASHGPRVGLRSAGGEDEGAARGEGEREEAHEAVVQVPHADRVAERLADHEHAPLAARRVRGKDASLEGREAVDDLEERLAASIGLGHTAGLAKGALCASEDWRVGIPHA